MAPAIQENEDREVVMFRESAAIFQNAPAILKENKLSVSNAKAFAQRLIDEYKAAGNKWSAELDVKANNFLIKIGTTISSMNEKRTPFTQLATALSKQFTSLETELDVSAKTPNVFSEIQGLRNGWAKWLIEDAERKRIEAEKLAAIEKDKAQLTGWILQRIGELLTDYLFQRKQAWTNSFNAITLESYETSAEKLRKAGTAFDRVKLVDILKYDLPYYSRLSDKDLTTTRTAAHDSFDFGAWIARYDQEMEELKQGLIDRLPSKKQELEEDAERERIRKEDEKKRKEAEAERQRQIDAANEKEKIRLQKKAEEDRAAERKRLEAQQKEEEDRKKAQAQREKEEQDRLQLEKEQALQKSKESAELTTSAMTAKTLFDQVAATSVLEEAPDARQGFEIIVTNPAGWVEIFQFWYQRKGVKMAVDKMGAVKLDSMKTFAEAAAKDTPKQKAERISSQFLRYELDVRAVNKQTKKEGE